MLLHQVELLHGERRRLEQQCIGDTDLADVVQIAAPIERREVLGGQVQRGTERDGIVRQTLAMPVSVLVPRFDDQREAAKDALGGVEVVGVLLEADERGDPGLQLLAVERLGDEIVGAGPQAADLVSRSFNPVTRATGISLVSGARLICGQTSKPLIPGIWTSSSTRSTRTWRSVSSAASPEATVSTS